MDKEIEKKYAIKELPNNIEISKIIDIEQSFIYKDNNTIIRIRKVIDNKNKSTKYVYTIKTKGDIQYDNNYKIGQRYEIENDISQKEYEELIQRKISNTIKKTRIIVPIEQNLKVEIDIYYEYLDGLLTAEIEFPNEEMARTYIKPDWLGEELGYKELSNGKLSQMTREEFESKISAEFINKNKKIINQLRKKL